MGDHGKFRGTLASRGGVDLPYNRAWPPRETLAGLFLCRSTCLCPRRRASEAMATLARHV
jgi:hypothetical protein